MADDKRFSGSENKSHYIYYLFFIVKQEEWLCSAKSHSRAKLEKKVLIISLKYQSCTKHIVQSLSSSVATTDKNRNSAVILLSHMWPYIKAKVTEPGMHELVNPNRGLKTSL